ncbi:MAG: PcfB family protein [Ruminococcaceae bacterium]|nr:PcfB family protein [Oscillospiraceae bacterium]
MKVIALSFKAGRATGEALKKAMLEYLNGLSHPTGEQTVAQLMKQNQGLTNIEVTDGNIKSFEKTAKKYGIDFALKKDASQSPPKYMVFFKARDVDVMTAAFKEYSYKEIKKSKKPSIRKQLANALTKIRGQKQREKVKTKERGQEL